MSGGASETQSSPRGRLGVESGKHKLGSHLPFVVRLRDLAETASLSQPQCPYLYSG